MMAFGCLVSVGVYLGVALLLWRPALFPLLVGFVLVMWVTHKVMSDPDWPLY